MNQRSRKDFKPTYLQATAHTKNANLMLITVGHHEAIICRSDADGSIL